MYLLYLLTLHTTSAINLRSGTSPKSDGGVKIAMEGSAGAEGEEEVPAERSPLLRMPPEIMRAEGSDEDSQMNDLTHDPSDAAEILDDNQRSSEDTPRASEFNLDDGDITGGRSRDSAPQLTEYVTGSDPTTVEPAEPEIVDSFTIPTALGTVSSNDDLFKEWLMPDYEASDPSSDEGKLVKEIWTDLQEWRKQKAEQDPAYKVSITLIH